LARAEQSLLEITKDFDPTSVKAHDAKVSVKDGLLLIETGHEGGQAGIAVRAPDSTWDLTKYQDVAFEVKNVGDHNVTVHCRVDSPDDANGKRSLDGSIEVAPGEKKTLRVFLSKRLSRELRKNFFGMRGTPNQVWTPGIDASHITQAIIYVDKPAEDYRFEIGNVHACESTDKDALFPDDQFFPMIDTFGQYMHRDWPGKIKSEADFADRKKDEKADLAAHPRFADRDKYSGWKDGPKLKATGFFRTEKVDGKWWLVDPEGHLFWSNGITCVRAHDAVTPVTGREKWFADLPKPDAPLAKFYGKGYWGPHTENEGKTCQDFDFSGANLLRKYGPNWESGYRQLACQRLLSWGITTIANWSDSEICLLNKIPFTPTFSMNGRALKVTDGWWSRFSDVFDPGFGDEVGDSVKKNPLFNDPWCIGIFVNNELSWGTDGISLAVATLRAPADQPAKLAFLDDLKKKYSTIDKLNEAWGTQHASWDALLQSTTPPDKMKAKADLEAFYTRTAERYFEVCRDAVRRVAPNHLYLGCRFASFGQNDLAIRAAAKYCDVISFNVYKHTSEFRLPEGVDKPVVFGEFHFGALDRGMFHTGLAGAANQQERANKYKAYVESAIDNPNIVGVHWFQYMDQATTGRGDGENYQIGFVDSCDTPNPEIIQAAREVGKELYPRRAGK
jgi:hypothetical protein